MGGQACGGGLHMIDVRTPGEPVFLGCFADATTGSQRAGYSHDTQCVIYRGPDEEYRAARSPSVPAPPPLIGISDVTNRENPVAIARGDYPNVGYTHQGWLTEDQRYFFHGGRSAGECRSDADADLGRGRPG